MPVRESAKQGHKRGSRLLRQHEEAFQFAVAKCQRGQTLEPLKGWLYHGMPYKFTTMDVTEDEFKMLYWGGVWLAINDGGGGDEMHILERGKMYREEMYSALLIDRYTAEYGKDEKASRRAFLAASESRARRRKEIAQADKG